MILRVDWAELGCYSSLWSNSCYHLKAQLRLEHPKWLTHVWLLVLAGVLVQSTLVIISMWLGILSMASVRVSEVWEDGSCKACKIQPWNWHTALGAASLVAQMVKNLPAMQETQVQSLSGEDPLEKEMATHSSILAWEIPWTEEPSRLQSMGSQNSWAWLSH